MHVHNSHLKINHKSVVFVHFVDLLFTLSQNSWFFPSQPCIFSFCYLSQVAKYMFWLSEVDLLFCQRLWLGLLLLLVFEIRSPLTVSFLSCLWFREHLTPSCLCVVSITSTWCSVRSVGECDGWTAVSWSGHWMGGEMMLLHLMLSAVLVFLFANR